MRSFLARASEGKAFFGGRRSPTPGVSVDVQSRGADFGKAP
jgi:hypothetical protein